MNRLLLALVFVAVAGTAGAQTAHAPSSTDIPMNTRMGAPEGVNMAPDIATAPVRMSTAAATAKKRIEMDGYKDVQGLAKGADGLWQGTAMRGNTSVQVVVDRAGNVAAK